MVLKNTDLSTMRQRILLIGSILLACIVGCNKTNHETPDPSPKMSRAEKVLNLTPSFISSFSGVAEGLEYEYGDTLTLELSAGEILSSGFAEYHMQHIFVHVNDTVYVPEFPETEEEYVQSISVNIVVPEEDAFDVAVVYSVQQKLSDNGSRLSLVDTDKSIVLYGVHPEMKYKYFDCYLGTPEAYTITGIDVKIGDGEWQNLEEIKGCSYERTEAFDWLYNVSIRPDYKDLTEDVQIRVKGEQHARHTISWKGTEYLRTDIPEGWIQPCLPTEAIDGEEVVATFYTQNEYYLVDATSNVENLDIECRSRAYVIFTMPAADVEVSLNFQKKAEVSFTESANITSAKIYDQPDLYYGVPTEIGIPGENVYLFVNVAEGYKPVAAELNGKQYPFAIYGSGIDKYAYYAAVTLPEEKGPFAISATAAKAFTVSYESGKFQLPGGDTYVPGETVQFNVYVPEGKTIKEVTAEAESGDAVSVEMDNASGTFTMPASNVSLAIVYSDIDSGETVHISAIFDANQYSVGSQTTPYYQKITESGFDVPSGTTLYINIVDDYGEPFWVGVKMGDEVTYYQATIDPDMGDASFGKSFVFTDDTIFKVGATKESVQFETGGKVNVKATFNSDDFIVKSSTNFSWNFSEGFTVDAGTSFYLTVQNMYGESFYVGIKIGDDVTIIEATEDEDSGEYTFGQSITATADVQIKVGYSSTSVSF